MIKNKYELKRRDYRIRQVREAVLSRYSRLNDVHIVRCSQFGVSALDYVPLLNEGWYVLLMHSENIKRLREEDRVACYPNRVKAKGGHKFLPSYNDNPIIADLSVPENEVHALRLDDNGDIRTEAGITKLIFSH